MLLQVALDFMDATEAVRIASCVGSSADYVEAGTSLIKRDGIGIVSSMREAAPSATIVADLKTMDDGPFEALLAFDAGAGIMTVLGCANDATVEAVVSVAATRGRQVMADMINVADVVTRARRLATLGVHILCVHTGSDESTYGQPPLATVAALRDAVTTPLAVAGALTPTTLRPLLPFAPDIVIVGSYITRASDPAAAAQTVRDTLSEALT